MSDLQKLINFIKTSGASYTPYSSNKWEWEIELSRAIPNWRTIAKDPASWVSLEQVRSKGISYGSLCRKIVDAAGLKLAARWFRSEVEDQRNAARYWFRNNLAMYDQFEQEVKEYLLDNSFYEILKALNVKIWQDFTNDMKNRFIEELFDRNKGEPLETIKEYIRAIEHLLHEIHHYEEEGRRFKLGLDFLQGIPPIGGYIPSPSVEKVRSIIKDAGDRKYLDRINEMISQREKACQNMSVPGIQMQHRIPYGPNRNERELIARIMEKTSRSGYLPTALPPIIVSSETPPIFVAYPELEDQEKNNNRDEKDECQVPRNRERKRPETISIEELLGVYQPQHQQIIIYERGIKWRRNRFEEKWLFSVVLIHEISHWITHLLPKPGTPTWSTDMYILGETEVHEGWAQLMTWWIADEVGGKFKSTFEELNQNQSPPYRVFEDFKNEPIDKVMESLEKLRSLPWPARLQDWKRAIR